MLDYDLIVIIFEVGTPVGTNVVGIYTGLEGIDLTAYVGIVTKAAVGTETLA